MTETHETHTDKARAKVRETVKKITEAENDLARNAIDYAEALKSGNKDRCLALLEQQDAVRRNLRMHNDFLPIHQEAVDEAIKLDELPIIQAEMAEAQRLCDEEVVLIENYYKAAAAMQEANLALLHHSHRTNTACGALKQKTHRPNVQRARFTKPQYMFEIGKQNFAHFTEQMEARP
ncbi:MAG: hypothetical protein RBR22_13745 [Desulfuromonas sp.]|nr:hypothetical protein [Desulfuromonas sp.]